MTPTKMCSVVTAQGVHAKSDNKGEGQPAHYLHEAETSDMNDISHIYIYMYVY